MSSRTTGAGRATTALPALSMTLAEPRPAFRSPLSESTARHLPSREMRAIGRDFVRGTARYLAYWIVALAVIFGLAACSDATGPVPVATVVVTAAKTNLESLGETVQLSAVAKDADGNVLEGRSFTWSSESAGVAVVSASAVVHAVANGQAKISAASEGITGSTVITVEQKVATVEISPANPSLPALGETVQLAAVGKDALGNAVPGKTAAWTSAAPDVVVANAATGVATAQANGEATVTATIDGVPATTTVVVAQVPVKLAFVGQILTTQHGVAIPGLDVVVQDARGAIVRTATPMVTLEIGANPSNGGLAGLATIRAANGAVSFVAGINNPGVGYTVTASAPGLTMATSAPFEVMSVPARIDSIRVSSTSLKVGTSVSYSVWVTNGAGRNLTPVAVQGYIQQGIINNGAGGSQVSGCGAAGGVMPHGTCKVNWAFSLSSGTYSAGPATGKVELREGTVLRGTVTVPVTIVP